VPCARQAASVTNTENDPKNYFTTKTTKSTKGEKNEGIPVIFLGKIAKDFF